MSQSLGYVKGESLLHQINPSVKFISLILVMTAIFVYPSWILSVVLLSITTLGFMIAGVSLKLSSRRIRFIILFSLMLILIQKMRSL